MNYPYQYFKLICNRIEHPLIEGYFELHHIIPRSEGGSDDNNTVRLTAREHYIAHKLLYKIYNDGKMAQAFVFMSNRLKNKNSKMYENAKIAARQLQSKAGKKGGKKAIKALLAKRTREQLVKGGKNTMAKLTPEERSARGRRAGKATKGSKWWNNGIECSLCKDCPGSGWIRGRLKKQKDRQDTTNEERKDF